MPANVESMFSVKETPWHKIGHVIHEAPTVEEGIKLSGLDWRVDVVPLMRADVLQQEIANTDSIAYLKTVLGKADASEFGNLFVRSDNGRTLGVVGPKTYPLQNEVAFNFFQPFLDAKAATLETAGSLDEGRKVWVMAKINRDNEVIAKDDEISKFVLLSNSHDGTTAVRVGFTPIRVVCANTLAMAHSDKASKLIRIRHSKDVVENLEKVGEIIDKADAEFKATAEQYKFLASRQISVKDLERYVKVICGLDESETDIPKKTQNIIEKITDIHELRTGMNKAIIESVVEKFEAGRGSDIASIRGTYWSAYNAVNEYYNYERGRTQDNRLNVLWFGTGVKDNRKALDLAIEMAA